MSDRTFYRLVIGGTVALIVLMVAMFYDACVRGTPKQCSDTVTAFAIGAAIGMVAGSRR